MRIDVVADGLGFTEGPVCLSDGRVAITSISHGCVYIVDPQGGAERIPTGGGPNGLAVDDIDVLYVAQNGGIFSGSGAAPAGIQKIEGSSASYLVDDLDAPNDLVFGPDGRLWITDTRGEIDYASPDYGLPGKIWAYDITTGAIELLTDQGPVFLNGLAFNRAGDTLLVTATMSSRLLAYDVAPRGDASWTQPREVATFDNGWPDGMAVSARDEAWVALTAADRLDVVDPDGAIVGTIPLPPGSLPTNVCLNTRNPRGLYVTAAHGQSLLHITLDDVYPALV